MSKEMNHCNLVLYSHNNSLELQNCLKRFLDQSCGCFSIIIIDDCSTDNTFEVAKNFKKLFSKVTIIQNTVKLGELASYYNILKLLDKKITIFFSVIDTPLADMVASINKSFNRDKRPTSVHFNCKVLKKKSNYQRVPNYPANINNLDTGVKILSFLLKEDNIDFLIGGSYAFDTAYLKERVEMLELIFNPYELKDKYIPLILLLLIYHSGIFYSISAKLYSYNEDKHVLYGSNQRQKIENLKALISYTTDSLKYLDDTVNNQIEYKEHLGNISEYTFSLLKDRINYMLDSLVLLTN